MARVTQKKADNSNLTVGAISEERPNKRIAPSSSELIIGLVGYAGAGCTAIATSLYVALSEAGYEPHSIKLSKIIADNSPVGSIRDIRNEVPHKGTDTLERAKSLQDAGDRLRVGNPQKLASLAIEEIRSIRGERKIGKQRIAYILDSLKNLAEIELLREVYGQSFRLMAVHCDRDRRLNRLFGKLATDAKFAGASRSQVEEFMDRDEKDASTVYGQQVRDVFHLADYFVNDNVDEKINISNNYDLKRFFEILLGAKFHRPTPNETAMYTAFSAALRSSCLSRQVGAALVSSNNQLDTSKYLPLFGKS
ncbi:MAG: hypothetical protein ACSHXI_20580 [Hoeflea sp.]|uniref:hypothetical protein n=1 Tax=Hoeflea sp. TaxID=1940281 RepID=UPI003EF20C4C